MKKKPVANGHNFIECETVPWYRIKKQSKRKMIKYQRLR